MDPGLDLEVAIDVLVAAYAWTYRLAAWEDADATTMSAAFDHATSCDLLASELAELDRAVRSTTADAAVPSCPGWSVADLARHLGLVSDETTSLAATASKAG